MEEEIQQPVKYRIGILMGLALIGIAGIFDLVELILSLVSGGLASYIKDFAQIIFFPAIFLFLKAPFWKGKKAAKKLISFCAASTVSFLWAVSDVLPEVIIGVAFTIYYTRQEDKEAMKNPEVARNRNRNITRFKRVREKIRDGGQNRPHQQLRNPNSVGELISVGRDIKTRSNMAYRSVVGNEAIEDLYNHGYVRNAFSAGRKKNSRWGDRVFWSKGTDGKHHGIQPNAYVIEAPISATEKGPVKLEDIEAIYHKTLEGEIKNILEERNKNK